MCLFNSLRTERFSHLQIGRFHAGGAISSTDIGTSLRAFFNEGFSTTCSLSYTDLNGQTVSHSFNSASVLVAGDYVGSTTAFSATNGWFERVAPTVVLSGLSGSVGAGGQTVTAAFSEDVKDFVAGDLDLSNAAVSGFTTVNASTYTFLVTPVAAGSVSVQIPAAALTDLPNNDNTASNTLSATADFADPGVAISGLPATFPARPYLTPPSPLMKASLVLWRQISRFRAGV